MTINAIQTLVDNHGIIFLNYGEFLSQTLISAMTEALEEEAKSQEVEPGVSGDIFTVFIELSQNMMSYAKNEDFNNTKIESGGLILVSKDNDGNYFIESQNIVSSMAKDNMMLKLIDITTLEKIDIKKRYKELRRSGNSFSTNGCGLGFYEIAKRCDNVEYNFKKISEDRYYFHIKTKINL